MFISYIYVLKKMEELWFDWYFVLYKLVLVGGDVID